MNILRTWKEYAQFLDSNIIKENPKIAIMGCFQNGKSTLINCFLDGLWALTGNGKSTTSIATIYRYNSQEKIYYRHKSGKKERTSLKNILNPKILQNISMLNDFQAEIYIKNDFLSRIDLIDTPGFNANNSDTVISNQTLKNVDFVLFVTNNSSLTLGEKDILRKIVSFNIKFSVLMNCTSCRGSIRWLPNHGINKEIAKDIEMDLISNGLIPVKINNEYILPCNFLFYWSNCEGFARSIGYFSEAEQIDDEINYVLKKNNISISVENRILHSGFLAIKNFILTEFSDFNPLVKIK